MKTFTKLNLRAKQIGAEGTKYLAAGLQNNKVRFLKNIHQLYIHSIRTTQTLTTLNLHWNNIDTQGAQYLSNMLKINMVR